jgi:Tol biopolymer transport system component/DNA-binding winged helix-turn-helix (wHTH) protein
MKILPGSQMEPPNCIFRFADVEVDERNFSVTKAGEVLSVEPKVFKVLQFLLHHADRVVTKDELLDAVWNDCSVSESSLTRSVATLRRLLGDDIREPRYIATVPTVGYRFLCDVTVTENGFPPGRAVDTFRDSSAEPISAQLPPPERRPEPQRKRVLVALAALILIGAAGWFSYKTWRASTPAPPAQRALTRFTSGEGQQTGATWSPDGRFIAYSSDRSGTYNIWIQQISGGDPVQITKDTGQNWMPDWSPDGKYIAYRSEEGEGGIYITPALGGEGQQRKIASFGYYPHWSPDSSRILFQTSLFLSYVPNRIYVVALDESAPREVLIETVKRHNAVFAVWHPDGKRVTAWIAADSFDPTPTFSTEPIDGGSAIESRFSPELQKQIEDLATAAGTGEPRVDFRFAWAPSGKAIYFERTFRGARNIWRTIVDPITLQPLKVERLTTSPGPDTELSVSPDGTRLAFTSEHHQIRAYAFRFDANHGRITGPGDPISSPEIEAGSLNLSRDGTKLGVGGQNGSWEFLIPNGHEEPLVAGDSYLRDPPIWSPDGTRAAYVRSRPSSDKSQIVVWSSKTRTEETLGAENSISKVVYDWSPDGKSVLVSQGNDQTHRSEIWQLAIEPSLSGEPSARKIAADPNYDLWQPHISRDGRWIVFEGVRNLLDRPDSTLFAISAAGRPRIQLTDGKQWDDKPRWSPDGRTIYFLSYHHGFFNVWGMHFDPVQGHPQGEPFQITSFETQALKIPRYIALVDFSLTDGRLVLPMAQTSGNIWILDNVDK